MKIVEEPPVKSSPSWGAYGMEDLSSATRNGTREPSSGSVES